MGFKHWIFAAALVVLSACDGEALVGEGAVVGFDSPPLGADAGSLEDESLLWPTSNVERDARLTDPLWDTSEKNYLLE